MLKGIHQEKRNNAWHLRHTKKKASDRAHRSTRLSFYKVGGNTMKRAEKQFKAAQEREKQITVGFWRKLKYLFIMARLKLKHLIKSLAETISQKCSSLFKRIISEKYI